MKSLFTLITLVLLLSIGIPANAQTFQQCADVTQNGNVSLSDLMMMVNVFIGGPDLPAGRGDIDFRQGFNLGDVRYLNGYIFTAYPEGGCPPFPAYNLAGTTDTIFLPEAIVPAGSGSLVLPIVLSNLQPISDLALYSTMSATNCTATIDSVSFSDWNLQLQTDASMGNDLSFLWVSTGEPSSLSPGTRTIARVWLSFSASTGGTVTFNPTSLGTYRFTHEVYGEIAALNYAALGIGIPQVVVRPTMNAAAMSVVPDSLFFVVLAELGDPSPKTFDVLSDGAAFDWSATHPSWINLTPSFGSSGTSVSVQPLTAGLTPGTYTGSIVVSSIQTFNSPKTVKVVLKIQPQYAAFDANCDGIFSVTDVVILIQYIFGGPAPCDPCNLK